MSTEHAEDHLSCSDCDSTLLEVTAPVRVEGQSNSEAVFAWMRVNQNLWMLDGEWADRVENLVGTARLIRLVAKRMRFQRGNRSHAALQLPDDEDVREHAYRRLGRFLELHIDLEH